MCIYVGRVPILRALRYRADTENTVPVVIHVNLCVTLCGLAASNLCELEECGVRSDM